MQISKWHEGARKRVARRAAYRVPRRQRVATESHYVSIDGEAFERIERLARKRRTTIDRLMDAAINWMLDREAAL